MEDEATKKTQTSRESGNESERLKSCAINSPMICPHCGSYNYFVEPNNNSLICSQCLKAFNNNNYLINTFIPSLYKINNNDDIMLEVKYCNYKKYTLATIKLMLLATLIKYIPVVINKYNYDLVYMIIKLISLLVVICVICYSFFLTITFRAIYIYKNRIIKKSYLSKLTKIDFEKSSFIKMLGSYVFFDKSKSNILIKKGISLENYLLDEITQAKLSILLEYISGRPAILFSKYKVAIDDFISKESK